MSKKMKQMERSAGILLPISSLPSKYGIGNLGAEAYAFVDYLVECGQKVWQILPIGTTSFGDSPYQSFSAFAGNPYFIDLDALIGEGLLENSDLEGIDWGSNPSEIEYDKIYFNRYNVLRKAFARFNGSKEYDKFYKENKTWLDEYGLYMSVKATFDNKSWLEWNDDIRLYQDAAVARYKKELKDEIAFWCFLQFKFFEQWYKLKEYANSKGVKIIGDIPIYVSMDSADTWANPELFLLDENHNPTVVAGCPPDSFSADGQLWGNSIYDWKKMSEDGYSWWKKRIEFSATIYDVIRIDHFIGIVRYYTIPAGDTDARGGKFEEGPGYALIEAIDEARGDTEIIAEDLGVVVEAVTELMAKSGYPGMKILQHAFGSDTNNEHLPINYVPNYCVYLGTHDNDTIVSAIQDNMDDKAREFMKNYLNVPNLDDIVWDLMREAYRSVACLAVIQMQDVLGLTNEARMNIPSTVGINWKWRVTKEQMTKSIADGLSYLARTYGR